MKRLYLHYLNLRVWFMRRRLQQMNFREAADRVSARSLIRRQPSHELILPWFKIVVIPIGIAIWLIFYLHLAEPIRATVPRPEKAHSAPSFPDTVHPHFVEPNLHRPIA